MVYKIGNLKLKSRVLLAPMLEPNDVAFRVLCKKARCGLTYTGMVSPLSKEKMFLDDKPAVQLFGNSSKGVGKFIKKYDSRVSLWDFNLGCSSKLSKKLRHGVFMHENLDAIIDILKVMRDSSDKPVTIKLRADNALKVAKAVEKYVDAIGIHARAAEQGYSGNVDYDFALKLKKSVGVPVIYSGNVNKDNVDDVLKDFDLCLLGGLVLEIRDFFLEGKLNLMSI